MDLILNQPNPYRLFNGIQDSIANPLHKKHSAPSTTTYGKLAETGFATEADTISGATALVSRLLVTDSVDVPTLIAAQSTPAGTIETERKRVIIVGAGISGLRAAALLLRHGVDVVILEGREDRIGGRICTSRRHENRHRDIGNTT